MAATIAPGMAEPIASNAPLDRAAAAGRLDAVYAEIAQASRIAGRDADDVTLVAVSKTHPAAAIEALSAGADDHIAKPFDFAVLTARIERVMARARRITALKRSNAALDARIAARAMELGEAKTELADARAERLRLIASIQSLNDTLERLSPGTSAV